MSLSQETLQSSRKLLLWKFWGANKRGKAWEITTDLSTVLLLYSPFILCSSTWEAVLCSNSHTFLCWALWAGSGVRREEAWAAARGIHLILLPPSQKWAKCHDLGDRKTAYPEWSLWQNRVLKAWSSIPVCLPRPSCLVALLAPPARPNIHSYFPQFYEWFPGIFY